MITAAWAYRIRFHGQIKTSKVTFIVSGLNEKEYSKNYKAMRQQYERAGVIVETSLVAWYD